MLDDEKKYWLGFSAFPGIGPLRFKILLKYFGSAKKAWEAREKELIAIGLGEKLTQKFISFRSSFSLISCINSLIQKKIAVVTVKDKEYPELLEEVPDCPFILYVRGDISKCCPSIFKNCVAVVGTRKMTNYGREVTEKITRGLIDAGITVVSGMAYGIDAVAHLTAINSNGKTIAVLGCGVDIIHPVSNTTLYWQIIKKHGLVISEFPPGLRSTKGLFPARNRIISGLSLGVVVTEGAEDSGALITARYAAEQGREVFAIPGPITSQLSKGPTFLLKQGAKLVTGAEDVLEELKIQNSCLAGRQAKCNPPAGGQNLKLANLSKEETIIIELLQNENLHFDEVVRKSGMPSDQLASILTMMEIKGLIRNIEGGVYGIIS